LTGTLPKGSLASRGMRYLLPGEPALRPNASMLAIAGVMIAFTLFIIGAPILAAAWLAVLGQWKAIGMGVVFFVTGLTVFAVALLPVAVLGGAGVRAAEAGRTFLAGVATMCMTVYLCALMVTWCALMLLYFRDMANRSTLSPILLWSCMPAVGPWMFIARHGQQEPGENLSDKLAVLCLSSGYIASLAASLFWGASIWTCIWILAAAMFAFLVITLMMLVEEYRQHGRFL